MARSERDVTDRIVVMLDTLRSVFNSDDDVARALEVDPAQVSRWYRGQQPGEAAWDRAVDPFAIISKMESLYQPSRVLNTERPPTAMTQ